MEFKKGKFAVQGQVANSVNDMSIENSTNG